MSAVGLLLLTLAVSDESAVAVPSGSPPQTTAAAPALAEDELRAAVATAIGKLSRTSTTEPTPEVVHELVDLFVVLMDDDSLPLAERGRLARVVEGRLTRAGELIAKRLAKEAREAKRAAARARTRPGSLDGGEDTLAQVGGGQQPPPGGGGGAGGQNQSGGLGRGPVDTGQDLVDLIQRTISPETWDVNGGKGSIRYYRPLQVLVIRAPGRVHGDVGGALGGLRQ